MNTLPLEILEQVLYSITEIQDLRSWICACASLSNFRPLYSFLLSLNEIQKIFGQEKSIWPDISITIKDPSQDPRMAFLRDLIQPYSRFFRTISFGKSPKMIGYEFNVNHRLITFCESFVSSTHPYLSLSICHASLTMESVACFASSLTRFHRVSLIKCKINDDALKWILKELKKCPLDRLSLENCLLGDKSSLHVSEFLLNSDLRILDLTFVYIDELGGKVLSEAISKSSLREFNLLSSRLSVGSLPYFAQKVKNLKISLLDTKVILSQ